MRLGIVMLDPASTLNNLKYISHAQFSAGETGEIMFQLVDLDSQINSNVYARYMPQTSATLTAVMSSNNNANIITKTATQPFADDKSIWKLAVSAADTAKMAGVNIKVTLTEGASVKIGWGKNSVVMIPNPYQC